MQASTIDSNGIDVELFAHHGGRLAVARSLLPDAPQPWIDLSTGINKRCYRAPRATIAARNRLPEPTQLAELEATAATAFRVSDPARVVAVAGTELALRLLPYALNLRDAAVLGPTYGSHADAWKRAGARTSSVTDTTLDSCLNQTLALTVVNPNNPDGRVLSRERLLELHDRVTPAGALIVDEAFADIAPEISVSSIAGSERAPRLIVLRSFGKFYGLAGIRLGFIVAATSIANTIRHIVGDWPVSADALAAGRAAYSDYHWAERTREWLHQASQRLDTLLLRHGFEIAGGTSLYRLARVADARHRFLKLLRAGVLVRPFDHDGTLLRFGIPHGRTEWTRLAAALAGQHD